MVWPNSDIPLHRGGIHIWSNLVFIHYWVLPKKLSILGIDTWGENPFFNPLLIQAKFASGAFGAHGPALSGQFPGRGWGEGGGSRRKGSGAGEPPVDSTYMLRVFASNLKGYFDRTKGLQSSSLLHSYRR